MSFELYIKKGSGGGYEEPSTTGCNNPEGTTGAIVGGVGVGEHVDDTISLVGAFDGGEGCVI